MCSFPSSLISMFKVQLEAGAEVTFPVTMPTAQGKKQFGTEERIYFHFKLIVNLNITILALENPLEGMVW